MTGVNNPSTPRGGCENRNPDQLWPRLNERGRGPAAWRPRLPAARRSVILTGGSHGVGAALFAALHAQGDRILLLGQRFSADQRAAAEPGRVALRYTDLIDPATLPTAAELAAFLAGADGDEAALVHGAAMVEPAGPVGTLDCADLDAAVQVNVLAPMWLTNLFLGAAPANLRRLRIVYVTSRAAHRPAADSATYRATAAAGEMFMRCVREGADPRCVVDLVDEATLDPAHLFAR